VFIDRDRVTREVVGAISVLQQLSLLSITKAYDIDSTTAPGLSMLTGLRDLSFIKCLYFKPAGFMTFTALTRLHLQDLTLFLPELLRILPLLQQLEELVMNGNYMKAVGLPIPNPSYEDFAPFTASSKLKTLGCQLGSTPLPPSSFAAMFGGSKQLTALTDLMFVTNPYQIRGLGTTELQAIARSCRNLKCLKTHGCVQTDVDWSVISQLQDLWGIDVSHASDADAGQIASPVQLEYLTFSQRC
jgi:hypothetical protein